MKQAAKLMQRGPRPARAPAATAPKSGQVIPLLGSKPAFVDAYNADWVRTDLMDVPPYHGVRTPVENSNRRRALQRHLDKAKGTADALPEGFSFLRCEPCAVNFITATGRVNVIDGVGRRWMAMEQTTQPIAALFCRIYTDLTPEQEVDLYKWFLSQRTKGRPLDEKLADREFDPKVDAIMSVVEECGFQITGSRKEGTGRHISYGAAAFAYYLGGADLLRVVLYHVKKTIWGSSPLTTSTHIAMLSAVIGRNRDLAGAKRIRETMNALSPGRLHHAAFAQAQDMEIRKAQPRHLAWLMTFPFLEKFNHKLGAASRIKPGSVVFKYGEVDMPDADAGDKLNDVYWPFPPTPKIEVDE